MDPFGAITNDDFVAIAGTEVDGSNYYEIMTVDDMAAHAATGYFDGVTITHVGIVKEDNDDFYQSIMPLFG